LLAQVEGVAHIFDIGHFPISLGQAEEASRFVVFEYVDGERLDHFVDRASADTNKGGLGSDDFFSLSRQLATIIGELHRRGLIHGDIWPRNIILRDGCHPILIDFGQSVIRAEARFAPPDQSQHAYLAPEGRRSVEADVFSLCATLFYIAAGKDPPKSARDLDVLRDRLSDGIRTRNPSLYAASSGIVDIIAGGLRYVDLERTPHTERLLQNIDLFDPARAYSEKEVMDDVGEIHRLAPAILTKDPVFGRMAGRRIRELRKYLEEMCDGMYEVRGDHDEIVMMLSEFIASCRPDDVYLTVSTPWLWSGKNLGVQGRFLSINKDMVKRGVVIRRIFLIAPDDVQDPEIRKILYAQKRVLDEIQEESEQRVNTVAPDLAKGGVFTGVKSVSKERREELVRLGSHNGMWIRGNQAKIALPNYSEDRKLAAVYLRPLDGSPAGLRNAFLREFLNDAKELRSYLVDEQVPEAD